VSYTLRPVRDLRGGCRVFEYRAANQSGRAVPLTACRSGAGVWQIR
jgi:hypothetical protein